MLSHVRSAHNFGIQHAFTLIELIIVILILGILAATALPRFINLKDESIITRHRAVVAAYRSAVSMARQQWILAGSIPNIQDLKVFEDAYRGQTDI